MLKDLIQEKHISVYSVAKGSGVPYTTLNELVNEKKSVEDCSVKTIAALARYFGTSIDVFLSKSIPQTDKAVISQSWEEKRKHTYHFPLVASTTAYDASRIHPLKQREIKQLHSKLVKDDRIESLILFGSSTTIRCNKASDTDLCISVKPDKINAEIKNEISAIVQEVLNWKADIIWGDSVKKNSKLKQNIDMGVRII